MYDEDGKRVVRQLALEELNRLLRFQSVGWFERKGKIIGVRMIPQPQQSREYDRTGSFGGGMIRMAEIEANAMPGERECGVNRYGGNDPMIVGNFTDHAMSKIEWWPLIGDDKAVRVSNGLWCRLR